MSLNLQAKMLVYLFLALFAVSKDASFEWSNPTSVMVYTRTPLLTAVLATTYTEYTMLECHVIIS